MKTMKCKKCGYKWVPRVDKPKECPSCKRMLRKVKLAVILFVLLFAYPAQASWFEKTDFYFFGINTKGVKELSWWKVGLGAAASAGVHIAAHHVYAGLNGMDIEQHGLAEQDIGQYEPRKERECAQIGLIAQNLGGLILTSIPTTRQSDFTKGYVAAAFVETAFYPALFRGDSGDLYISNKYGGNADAEYFLNLGMATHNLLRIKWYKD